MSRNVNIRITDVDLYCHMSLLSLLDSLFMTEMKLSVTGMPSCYLRQALVAQGVVKVVFKRKQCDANCVKMIHRVSKSVKLITF